MTKILGKHELKFGGEGRLHQQNYIQTNAPNGYFNFGSVGSSQCPNPDITQCGGDGMASFMMGQLIGGGAYYEIQYRAGLRRTFNMPDLSRTTGRSRRSSR